VKAKKETWMEIEGTGFKCPDAPKCKDLQVRFGDPPKKAIYLSAVWLNETFVKVKIPKYTRPDVLVVELTLNG